MAITGILFVLFYLLDQVSKYLSEIYIKNTIVVIPGFLELTKVYNTGAAWSMLENGTWLLAIISLIASIVIGYFVFKNDWKKEKLKSFSITMAWAGCFANFFDRIISIIPPFNETREGVVDMIIFKPFDYICEFFHLGTTVFNVADMFLVIGLILFSIDYIFLSEKRKEKNANN